MVHFGLCVLLNLTPQSLVVLTCAFLLSLTQQPDLDSGLWEISDGRHSPALWAVKSLEPTLWDLGQSLAVFGRAQTCNYNFATFQAYGEKIVWLLDCKILGLCAVKTQEMAVTASGFVGWFLEPWFLQELQSSHDFVHVHFSALAGFPQKLYLPSRLGTKNAWIPASQGALRRMPITGRWSAWTHVGRRKVLTSVTGFWCMSSPVHVGLKVTSAT